MFDHFIQASYWMSFLAGKQTLVEGFQMIFVICASCIMICPIIYLALAGFSELD